MKKKVLSLLLSLCMVLSLFPMSGMAAGATEALTGDGSKENPYQIADAADLTAFRNAVNNTLTADELKMGYTANPAACAVLMADIVLNEGTFGMDEAGNPLYNGSVTIPDSVEQWAPIGSNGREYLGTFDGDGHTVSGLYLNAPALECAGLFGKIGYSNGIGAKLQNLGVDNSFVKGGESVGGVCGQSSRKATIENCYNKGAVTGDQVYGRIGGVCGWNFSTLKGCFNEGPVVAVKNNSSTGGVCGRNSGTVEGSYNIGTIRAQGKLTQIGGICGSSESSISNSYNTGSLYGVYRIGGICGYSSNTIENCFNIGTVGSAETVGGICAYESATLGSTVNCYYLEGCVTNGTAIGTEKSAGAFASGEVAHLLGEAFGQTLTGETPDDIPLLRALNETLPVYRITFTEYADETHTVNGYYNAGQTAEIPVDFKTGYRFQNAAGDWQDTFPVTGDSVYTAIPAPSYTVTIPEAVDFGKVERVLSSETAEAVIYADVDFDLTVSADWLKANQKQVGVTLYGPLTLKEAAGGGALPYTLWEKADGRLAAYNPGDVLYFGGEAEGSETTTASLKARLDKRGIRAASTYSGTMIFTIKLADKAF